LADSAILQVVDAERAWKQPNLCAGTHGWTQVAGGTGRFQYRRGLLGALETTDTEFAIRYQVLPLLRLEDALVVAVEDPLSMECAQDLRVKTGMTIIPVIANPQDLKVRIAKEYCNLDARAEGTGVGTNAPAGAPDPRRSRA
jgi:Type II secretion system (T2SS), protein E, N-terminal domain